MVNDPLFIKTKQELLNWKKQKKFKGQKTPDSIKDQIKALLEKYPRAEVTQNLELAASTIATFVNKTSKRSYRKNGSKVRPTEHTPNIFQQIPAKLIENKVSLLKFEIELPGKFMLRLFK